MPWMNWGDTSFIVIMFISMALGGLAQLYINSTYKKWARVGVTSGLTGEQAAYRILEKNNLGAGGRAPVKVVPTQAKLGDHYDPRTNMVALSTEVYSRPSVSGVAIAAHEVGHAIQHNTGYFWSNFRSALVPIVNLGSQAAGWLIIMGLIIQLTPLFWAGIIAYGIAVGFQLVTLPVEINASRRALIQLREAGIVNTNEEQGARQVLTAAALTYVAAALVSLLYLVYYIGLRRD